MKKNYKKSFSILLSLTTIFAIIISTPGTAYAEENHRDVAKINFSNVRAPIFSKTLEEFSNEDSITKTQISTYTLESVLSKQGINPTKKQVVSALGAGMETVEGTKKAPSLSTNVTEKEEAAQAFISAVACSLEIEEKTNAEKIIPKNHSDVNTVVDKENINTNELDKTLSIAAVEKIEQEKIIEEKEKEREKARIESAKQEQRDLNSALVAAAESQLGTPYVWGGTSPNRGLDCSGLTQYCYSTIGITTGRTTGNQHSNAYEIVPLSAAEPGDILWNNHHVGIYVGDGQYIHAPQPGDVVRYASNVNYFDCALRFTPTVESVS